MYQAMEIEPNFMRPVILHGFGTNAKKRLPNSLADLPNMDGCHLRQRYLARKIGSLSGYTTTSSQFLG